MRIYLAAPYTHPNPAVRLFRFKAVNRMAAKLLQEGHEVFSPLSMGHAIGSTCELPTDFVFWRSTCLSMIERWATHVYVLDLEGREESVGVREEMALAEKLGLVCEVKKAKRIDYVKCKIQWMLEKLNASKQKKEEVQASCVIRSYIKTHYFTNSINAKEFETIKEFITISILYLVCLILPFLLMISLLIRHYK